ncbi:hypothetical protein P43SY_002766 [Pythium insidiosum]|uniref:Uncharacterized protein n=1 Tax=Pythium insidiosum TaxID=114742 RepID=A0AAD5LU31_PYTIN|nr:hypothetical protein P43SY_002766 [Pythium insidiosum]
MRHKAIRILVLGNGAAGAEKQGLALAARLQRHLASVDAAVVYGGATTLLRIPMNTSSWLSRLPPALQLAAARMMGDPFAGYTVKRIIEERLASELEASHELFIWNGEGPNPYLAFLHHSSDIVATPDSVSMITEAILSGKRVHVIGAEHMKGKFGRFHTTIRDRGYVSRLQTAHESAPTIRASCGNGIEQELEDITSKLASQILERIS